MTLDINNLFSYHPPTKSQPKRYEEIRAAGKMLASVIEGRCPDSEEKSQAINYVRSAVMWANAAIACNE